MKDFQDFRISIDPKFYEEFGNTVIKQTALNLEFPITQENVGRFLSVIAGMNMNATLSILESYHAWVNLQTEQKDLQ